MVLAAALALLLQQTAPGSDPDFLRPCVDYIGLGEISSDGSTVRHKPLPAGEIVIVEPMKIYDFVEQRSLWGESRSRTLELQQMSYSDGPTDPLLGYAVLQDAGRRRITLGLGRVWADLEGRKFIPISGWPVEGPAIFRHNDWRPDLVRSYAKPVSYRRSQPGANAYDNSAPDPEFFESNGKGETRVKLGLFLDDIPAMMAAADRAEPCGRAS